MQNLSPVSKLTRAIDCSPTRRGGGIHGANDFTAMAAQNASGGSFDGDASSDGYDGVDEDDDDIPRTTMNMIRVSSVNTNDIKT